MRRLIILEADLTDEQVKQIVPSVNVYLGIWISDGRSLETEAELIRVHDLRI